MAWHCLLRGLVVVSILIVIILSLIVWVTRIGWLVYVRSFIILEGSSI
jgi:maltodextrin utilization protein YvdJ